MTGLKVSSELRLMFSWYRMRYTLLSAFPPSPFPLPNSLLCSHKFPNPDRYPLKQLFASISRRRYTRCIPQRLTPTPVVIHASARSLYFRPIHVYVPSCFVIFLPLRLRFPHPPSPLLNIIPIVVPHAMDAPAHAAVIWFGGAGWHSHAIDRLPCCIWGDVVLISASFDGAEEARRAFLFCYITGSYECGEGR